MIELKDISIKKSDKVIFNHMNTTFEFGKSYALIGQSGSGKSTLLNILAGIEKIKPEQLLINGQPQKFNRQFYRDKLGYLFQNYGLVDQLSIDDNLDIGLKFKKISKADKNELKEQYLQKFQLTNDKKRKVHTLSGGEQQRIALIRLIMKDPVIILADEPTGSLDPATGQKILNALLEMITDDKVLIMATHDMAIAQQCDVIINIQDLNKQ